MFDPRQFTPKCSLYNDTFSKANINMTGVKPCKYTNILANEICSILWLKYTPVKQSMLMHLNFHDMTTY